MFIFNKKPIKKLGDKKKPIKNLEDFKKQINSKLLKERLNEIDEELFEEMKKQAHEDIKEAANMLIKDEKFKQFCFQSAMSLTNVLQNFKKSPPLYSLTIILAGMFIRAEQQWIISINRKFNDKD